VRVALLSQFDERRQPRSKATLGMLIDRWLEVAVRANLSFFISLHNKIEHPYADNHG
jgi:hypothetical protein